MYYDYLLSEEELEAQDEPPQSHHACPNGCGKMRDANDYQECPACGHRRYETRLDKAAVFGADGPTTRRTLK